MWLCALLAQQGGKYFRLGDVKHPYFLCCQKIGEVEGTGLKQSLPI